ASAHRDRQAAEDRATRALPRPSVADGRGRPRRDAVLALQAGAHEGTALVAVQLLPARFLVAALHFRLLRRFSRGLVVAFGRGLVGLVALEAIVHELLVLLAAQALRFVGAVCEALVLRFGFLGLVRDRGQRPQRGGESGDEIDGFHVRRSPV